MERLRHVVQINILLGVWLVIAPLVMGYLGSTRELVNDSVVGVWLIGCSWWILSAAAGHSAAATLQMLAGLWLAAAPFVLHFQRMSRPFDNDIAIGLVSLVVSAATAWMVSTRVTRAA